MMRIAMSIPNRRFKTSVAVLLLGAIAPNAAFAHPGHDGTHNLMAGLLHPLAGLDHVLMIVSVSAWAALHSPRGRIGIAACLAFFVLIGAVLPLNGGLAVESAIAATVIGAGLLLAMGRRWPLWATGLVSAAFALIHGLAHGAEGPGHSGFYLAGLVISTATLALGASNLASRAADARSFWQRCGGLSGIATGFAMLV
jgi:urease accessory protein